MKNTDIDTMLDKSLQASPRFHLSPDFAQKVTLAVVKREQWKVNLKEYLIILGVIVGLLAVAVGVNYYMDRSIVTRILIFVSGNIIQVISVLFILNFILLTDRVLLPLLFNRWSRS